MLSIFNNLTYKTVIKYSIYLLILNFIFSKEFLVLNEEFLIILSFLAVFYGLQQALSNVLATSLDDRNLQIKKQFLSLYNNKKNFQQILINLFEKKIALHDSLKNYQKLLDKALLEIVSNRNLVYAELVNVHVDQLLTSYILKYNLELKNVYVTTLKEIENSLYNK